MAVPSADPLRLQVINRIVEVLKNITAGADYFFTPVAVAKGFVVSPSGYPAYAVRSETGGEIEMHSDAQFAESFYVSIHGAVQEIGDVVTPLERAIRDVRKAIETDFQPAAGAGSLITLATNIQFDAPPDINYGPEGQGPLAFFRQRLKVMVSGEFGEI